MSSFVTNLFLIGDEKALLHAVKSIPHIKMSSTLFMLLFLELIDVGKIVHATQILKLERGVGGRRWIPII